MTDQTDPVPTGQPTGAPDVVPDVAPVPAPQPPPSLHPAPGHWGAPPQPPPSWDPGSWDQNGWYQPGWGQSPWDAPSPPGWPPPPPPPPRRRGLAALLAVALVAVGAAAGAGIAIATRNTTSPSPAAATSSSTPAPGAGTGSSPSLAPLPTAPPAPSGSGSATSLDPAAIAAAVDPAVVDISVTLSSGGAEGTGMILTSSGEVLTNNHVVEGATRVTVQIAGQSRTYAATVIGVDPTDDVALVQMTGASGLPTAPLGNSASVKVGDQIVTLGNALGRGGPPAVTQGVVTALDQTITASDAGGSNPETLTGMIQVQAGIQPGDSGGPLVDSTGHVVGMTTAGSARARRSGTIGFAIPIDKALTIAQQIQSGGGANVQPGQRGILGVEIDPSAGVSGASVVQVQPGSPAAGAGITAGDVITGIDGTTISSGDALGVALRTHKPGDSVQVRWTDQAGAAHTAQVTLAVGPPA